MTIAERQFFILLLLLLQRDARIEQLEYEATHDHLTGAYNRSTFYTLLEHACQQRDRQFALLFCDLNDFKGINDTHGHAAGDLALAQTARRILGATRVGDAVGRVGGDEFAVLLAGANAVEAAIICDRISQAIKEPLSDGLAISSATGIAVWAEGETADQVMARADNAMYMAKRLKVSCRGDGSPCAVPIDQVQELDRALANGDIIPYFQPIALGSIPLSTK